MRIATASLYIVNPLRRQSFATLFSTHPLLAERVLRDQLAKATIVGES
jgi:Zn-dependent protease with chaperone function